MDVPCSFKHVDREASIKNKIVGRNGQRREVVPPLRVALRDTWRLKGCASFESF